MKKMVIFHCYVSSPGRVESERNRDHRAIPLPSQLGSSLQHVGLTEANPPACQGVKGFMQLPGSANNIATGTPNEDFFWGWNVGDWDVGRTNSFFFFYGFEWHYKNGSSNS